MAVSSRDYQPVAERHEGRIPWMYLDSVGKVTAGIGHMMPAAAAAAALPFVDDAGRRRRRRRSAPPSWPSRAPAP